MLRWFRNSRKKGREMASYGTNSLSAADSDINSALRNAGDPPGRSEFNNVYEQFDPKVDEWDGAGSTQTCPTCGGSGKLTKEQEHDLVALIPVRDRRLKPRRMILYLAATVFICLSVCTVCAVILFPRSVSLKLGDAKAGNITMPPGNHSKPSIIINSTVTFHNGNFFEAQVDNFTIEVNWDRYVVGSPEIIKAIKVPAHSTINHTFSLKTKYEAAEATKIRRICCGWSFNLAFVISISAKTHSLTLSSETSDSGVKFINCELKGREWSKSCL